MKIRMEELNNWMQKNKIVLLYVGCILFLILFYLKPFISLVNLTLKYERYNYLLFIPFLFLYFFVFIKDRPKFELSFSLKRGLFLILIGLLISGFSYIKVPLKYPLVRLFLFSLSFWMIFCGITLIFFKADILIRNKFAWFVLLLLLPLPTKPYEAIISFLQYGSAEGVDFIFKIFDKLIGFTYIRNELYFYFPNLSIYIAKECSGIRSTTALLLVGVMAVRLFLSTLGGRTIFIIISIIFSILKNSIRIATLSLLAVRVDRRWITHSNLHENGGMLFFGITLVLLVVAMFVIKKIELTIIRKRRKSSENSEINSIKNNSSIIEGKKL